ncbi:MAG: haloacid dehalogenase-like hydrolase [Firmicutes bacterium]|nr:haloacid dehalogenase-like hydrolase [Bacillota bacterium]
MKKPIVALMYDFDKTLSPKNMQDYGFMKGLGVTSGEFWETCTKMTKENQMDSILAYMYLMLEKGRGKFLLRREEFQKLGRSVKLFPGVTTWFDRMNEYCEEKGLVCEHYLLSSGLKEIIEGTEIAGKFKEIYAAEFLYDEKGVAIWPAMAVNYTSKTQFLYRINKGILDVTEQKELNRFVPDDERRVPFRNMVYFGDGDTDVPCMKLTKLNGGHSIVVYQKDKEEAERLINENRANFAFKANYSKGSALEKAVKAVIDEIATTEVLKRMEK